MTQTDRDRLVALKKAKDKKMTQRQAAEELQMSERHVRRLLARLRKVGDRRSCMGCEAALTARSASRRNKKR
jgi:predicted ArsR family transcriptional regulator